MRKGLSTITARDSKQLGVALSRFRRTQHLTQAKLALSAGMLQKTVSIVEQGKPGTRLGTLFKMLAALDLEVVLKLRAK